MLLERSQEPELMDDPEVAPEVLEQALREIEKLNRLFGGYGPSIEGVRRLTPAGARAVRILDVGTGSGDTPRKVVDWGRARGLDVRVHAIDLTEAAVERTRRLSRSHPEIDASLTDLFDLPESQPYDVVHAALVLHHFPGTSAERALQKMFALARWGVVVNDLHRHPLAWASAKMATALFADSPMVKNDAALSVRRAFTREELFQMCAASKLPRPEIAWRPMFRWRMLIRRTQGERRMA